MAKGKKGVDGVDKVIGLFPAGSHKMIERLLVRAAQRDAKMAGRNVKKALQGVTRGSRVSNKLVSHLAAELGRALRHRGDLGGNKTSIRQKSPDTGGRPFHFAHSVIHKGDAAPAASGKAGAGKTGRAAAHMRYIEREIAVERTSGKGLQNPAQAEEREARIHVVDGPGIELGAGRGNDNVHASSAGAGQGYIENPVKLANGEQVIFSFGTIGEQFEDRVRFWEALEEAEAHPDARVQHRLIVELPHEASAQARFEMVKEFAKRFERDGIPYWAALHAPGKDNDSRNYHAHIVYSERPAKRMVDPEKPQDGAKWDFEITKTYRTSSRNTRTSRPHRQTKAREYTAKNFIPNIRKSFSEVVNTFLERDDVKDKSGAAVRYDARSYKDMGVDAVPMRSINRIVADKLKGGKQTVLDGDYTKRMITAELREAAAKRQKDVMELIALDDVLRATAETGRPQAMNGKLPKELRVSPWANPSKAALGVASRKILEARHAALQIDVMERATTASLERIIAATSTKAVAAAAKTKDPVARGEAPSADGAGLLHAAALDELAATRASTAKARKSMAYVISNAVKEWRDLVGAPPPQISPAVKAAIRQMDRQEEVVEQEAQAPTQSTPETATENVEQQKTAGSAGVAEPQAEPATLSRGGTTGANAQRNRAGEAAQSPASTELSTPKDRPGGTATPATGLTTTPLRRGVAAEPGRLPMTMEERLKITMPPTNVDLEAASKTVSGWIKSVVETEPDPNKRVEALKALIADLSRGLQERRAELIRSVDGRAKGSTAVPTADTTIRVGAETTAEAPIEKAIDDAATGERDRSTATAALAPKTPVETAAVAQRGRRSPAPGIDMRERADRPPRHADLFAAPPEIRPAPTPAARSDAEAAVPKGQSMKKAAKNAPATDTTGSQASDEADDARRRKKHEEEKRKRKRQAVLGRKNRRSRSR